MHPLRRSGPATAFASALTLALAAGVQAQSPGGRAEWTERTERAEAFLQSFHDLRLFNGAALLVDEGEILFEGAFGASGLPGDEPNTPATRFRIASLTKQFTAALILRLEEEGLLRIDDPVGRHIEDFPPENADRITLHHLLTHTSGLPSYTRIPGFMETGAALPHSPRELLTLVWEAPLSFEPGTNFEYSNSGYVLLGWIAERVTGMNYDEALRSYVLAPLELGDTGYDHELDPPEGHARGHARDLAGYQPPRAIDPSVPYAAGMLYSTVGDLSRWAEALFLDGPADTAAVELAGGVDAAMAGDAMTAEEAYAEEPGAELVPGRLFRDSATLARMTTPAHASYAYGLVVRSHDVGDGRAIPVIEHSGGIFGFSSFLRVFPDHDRLIVLLDNTSSDLGPIVGGLTRILWGFDAVHPKPSIAERLLPIVESGGVEAAMSRFENWRRTRPEEYDYSPDQILMLAGHFRARDEREESDEADESQVPDERGEGDEGDEGEVPGEGDERGDGWATAVEILDAYIATTPASPAVRLALSELREESGDLQAAAAHITAALTYEPGDGPLLERLVELGVEAPLPLQLPVVEVDAAALEPLVGEYRIDPATTLTVTLDAGVLMAGRTGEEAFPLLPQAPTAFLLQGSPVRFLFEIQDGVANAVSVEEGGRRLTFPRIIG